MLVVHTIPAFSDNYIWLFHHQSERQAYVVDPGDAAPVLKALQEHQLELAGILVTHQHPDHIGGITELLNRHDIPVYGPADINLVSHPLGNGDKLWLADVDFSVLAVPGHTLNHLAYFGNTGSDQPPVLFCGDTLFAAGCGRLFEGSPQQMYDSLQGIADLPAHTLVYCAHEYTLSNLKFALAVDPDNQDLQQRNASCMKLREKDISTVPFTLAEDLKTNPFLRSQSPAIIAAAKNRASTEDPVSVFAAIRAWKDNF